MNKVKTTTIGGGAQYAKVSERLKQFRTDCPRASIITTPIPQEDGLVMFKAYILKDKADENSADATGHALQTKSGTKDFEKLETIAVGRALALLGYAADGDIASSEEMEEFLAHKEGEIAKKLAGVADKIAEAKTQAELLAIYTEHEGLGQELTALLTKRKEEIKAGK